MLLALACAGLAGCGPDRLEASRQRALAYFATNVRGTDPSWSPIFGYLHRRFGVVALDARGRPLHLAPDEERRGEVAAIFRRLWDPDATVRKEQIAALPSYIDRMSASALHCDRIPLPGDWESVLRHASDAGAYALTHAVLAGQWSIENGCVPPGELRGLQSAQLAFLERLAAQREALVATHDVGIDVWIEALAMLAYLEQAGRLRAEWLDALLALQQADGGWKKGGREERSDPHPTALAIWVLCARLQPERPPVRWIASREEADAATTSGALAPPAP